MLIRQMRELNAAPLLTICCALHLARPRTGRWGTFRTLALKRSAFLAQKRRAARELILEEGSAACIVCLCLSVAKDGSVGLGVISNTFCKSTNVQL